MRFGHHLPVSSVADIGLNIVKKILALTPGLSGAALAAEVIGIVQNFNDFISLYGTVQTIISDLQNSEYQEWIDFARADDATLTDADRLRILAQIVSVIDKTGVAALVAAYSYPMCATINN